MSDRWQDDAEYQRRRKIEWADTGINIDYAAELGVEAYKRWLAAGGGSITPHPEAREAVGEIVAHISDTAPLSAENIERAVDMILAAGGSPTTTPDGKQAFDSPGVLKDAAPTITPQPNGPPPYSPDIHNEPRVTTTPTTEPTEQQVEQCSQYLADNVITFEVGPNYWDGLHDRSKAEVRAMARAALVAAFLVTPEDQQVEEGEPTNEQLEAAKAVLLPSLIRDPERGSLSSCVTLIRLALRAALSEGQEAE